MGGLKEMNKTASRASRCSELADGMVESAIISADSFLPQMDADRVWNRFKSGGSECLQLWSFFINACVFYGPSLVLYFCLETITHFAFILTENVGLFGSAFKITESTF